MIKWKTKNPLVTPSFWQWWREWQCKKQGCLTIGPYYHMTQSHCRRCGKITHYASKGCKEWVLPWILDK